VGSNAIAVAHRNAVFMERINLAPSEPSRVLRLRADVRSGEGRTPPIHSLRPRPPIVAQTKVYSRLANP
jgi:hypothetical protein